MLPRWQVGDKAGNLGQIFLDLSVGIKDEVHPAYIMWPLGLSSVLSPELLCLSRCWNVQSAELLTCVLSARLWPTASPAINECEDIEIWLHIIIAFIAFIAGWRARTVPVWQEDIIAGLAENFRKLKLSSTQQSRLNSKFCIWNPGCFHVSIKTSLNLLHFEDESW